MCFNLLCVQVLPSVGRKLDGTSLACKATSPLGDGTASLTLDVHCMYSSKSKLSNYHIFHHSQMDQPC